MAWKEVLPEGYIILNPDCAAAEANRGTIFFEEE